MKVYKTKTCIVIESESSYYQVFEQWDKLINKDDLFGHLTHLTKTLETNPKAKSLIETELMAPIGSQEIWASGVTYYKSREARMDESKDSGGGDFYDRVYNAERPELFMKAVAHRTVGSGEKVKIRKDSKWNVPEPELTLMISSHGKLIGYTIGNDMSSRDIEGENPLYLPQAKCYDQSAAVGPCLYVTDEQLSPNTLIKLEILRNNQSVFSDTIAIDQIKRKFEQLIHYLYLEMSFPYGCLLMTGTGIVPPNDFTLDHGDEVRISIDHIGTLVNFIA
ncbi:MAG: fumarylacetoacetate hydrolase family protein [Marinoscillum sp.]